MGVTTLTTTTVTGEPRADLSKLSSWKLNVIISESLKKMLVLLVFHIISLETQLRVDTFHAAKPRISSERNKTSNEQV